jgi:NADH-quinone oxidoreductase subunit A
VGRFTRCRRLLHGSIFPLDHQLCAVHYFVFPWNHDIYAHQGIFEITQMIEQFGYVAAFLLAGIAFLGLILTIARFIRPNRPNVEKLSTYESGEEPIGNANTRFNPRFYVIALLFVLFEVELIFLFPWAVVFSNKSLRAIPAWSSYALWEMFLFVGILGLGLAFAWRRGYLNWEKPVQETKDIDSPVPDDAYKRFKKS